MPQNCLWQLFVATDLPVATFFCHGSRKSCHSSQAGLLLVLVPLCLCLSPVSVSLLRVCVSRLCLCLSPVPVAARFCFYNSLRAKRKLPHNSLWQLFVATDSPVAIYVFAEFTEKLPHFTGWFTVGSCECWYFWSFLCASFHPTACLHWQGPRCAVIHETVL